MSISSMAKSIVSKSPLVLPAEAAPVKAPPTRRLFLQRTATVAVAAGAAGILMNGSARSASAASRPSGAVRGYFTQIRKHENDHVTALVNALGSEARPKPTFQNLQQASYLDFVAASTLFENVGVAAYLGAAPAINSPTVLFDAASIALIEARHAGWLNTVSNLPLAGNIQDITQDHSYDVPLGPDTVGQLVTPYIASLNGGPAPTFSDVPSDANDIDILNYALLLEYLEAEFYNINVPLFIG